jgi:hypothetical protein
MLGELTGDETVYLVKSLRHFPQTLGIEIHGHLKRRMSHPLLPLLGGESPIHHQDGASA